MALQEGNQKNTIIPNINEELLELKGDLEEKDAQIALAKFLRYNVEFAVAFLLGVTLEAFQVMMINAMFCKNFSMFILSRGSSKSYTTAIYVILKALMEPGIKIIIASANFRTSREMFSYITKFLAAPGAELANQCFNAPIKRNDQFELHTKHGSSITVIPLSDSVRGKRCQLLVLDELLLLTPKMIDEVLMPFLSSAGDADFRIKIRAMERDLIREGKMDPKDKMLFENNSQMIGLSSASYQFQHLYTRFQDWCDFIEDPTKIKDADGEERSSYFVCQLGCYAIPDTILTRSFIESQKASCSEDSFRREFLAHFCDGSDGFFSAKKMEEATLAPGQLPCVTLTGDPNKKYIVGIDPNVSKSESSDYFAMSVIEIDEETQKGVLVHSFQYAGGDFKDYYQYLFYILKNFNVVLIVTDAMGIDQFMETINNSELYLSNGIQIKNIESWNGSKEGEEYVQMLQEAKKEYNPSNGTICIRQKPQESQWIARANTFLASSIEHKQLMFASKASSQPDYLTAGFNTHIPYLKYVKFRKFDEVPDEKEEAQIFEVRDFIDWQDFLLQDTKDQMASLEQSLTQGGTWRIDLPRSARSSTSADRSRKDNYSSLLLANWGRKIYFQLLTQPEKPAYEPVCIMGPGW